MYAALLPALMKNQIEAIHIVALSIDEKKSQGTPRHAQALKMLNEGKQMWRDKFNKKCPHCGMAL